MTIIEQLACLCGQYSTTATIEKCVSHQKMQKANGVDSTSLFDLKRGLFNTLCIFYRDNISSSLLRRIDFG